MFYQSKGLEVSNKMERLIVLNKKNIAIDNKKYKEWKDKKSVQIIRLKDIELVEQTHKRSFDLVKNSKKVEKISKYLHKTTRLEDPIVVRDLGHEKYQLVTGIKGLALATKLDHDFIPCINVKSKNWNQFAFMINHMPIDCDVVMRLKEITIPQSFKNCKPSPMKVKKAMDYYDENGRLDKSITVDGKGVLLNGYVRYIVAKLKKFNSVPIIFK